MKASKVVVIQRWVIVVLLIVFFVVFIWQNKLFDDQIETIDNYEALIEKMDTDHENLIEQWRNSYDVLQGKYADKIMECHKLQEELEQVGNSVEMPVYSYSYDEVILLAKVVQCEAGTYSEAPDSQKWVCQVILNRVAAKDFPNNITDVIYQKSQFVVTTNGSLEKCVLEPETLANVYEVLLYGTDLPSYVKYFYAGYLDTGWITTLPVYDRMQGTVFAYDSKD